MISYRFMSAFGLLAMMFFAWCLSSNRRVIPYRAILGGLFLQFTFALLILRTTPGQIFFSALGDFFTATLNCVDAGSSFVFGPQFKNYYFAFKVLPTIIFFSALMSLFYYLGLMQLIVRGVAVAMYKVMGTSGAETLSAAINIFVGQSEAPLAVKPYLGSMTRSELMAVMVGGFANIAGGVLATYVSMGIDAGHLVTASVISAPASLLIAKLMQPETDVPLTQKNIKIHIRSEATNAVDAISIGASEGLQLALNVGAMLIAFLALIALADIVISSAGQWFGMTWSLSLFLGKVFEPVALLLGVPWEDAGRVGELLGLKTVANEFVAYEKFSRWISPQSDVVLSDRAKLITTYALCGFANFGSIGIQIGGIGALVPERRRDLAQIALRAMIGGTLATFMCACVAGIVA